MKDVLKIVPAIVLGLLAFKFVSGMIKFAVLVVIVLVCALIAHLAGAF